MTPGASPLLATGRRGAALAAAMVIGPTILVYGPGLSAGFVGDDFMILHRLRQLTGVRDVLRFFGAEFFEYYRPLAFVAHAADYAVAGADPRQFHVTNLLLHSVNGVLVLLIGRRLSPHSLAGPIAALLFALHASNHEAVMWISARFDLLATTFALAALWRMTRPGSIQVVPAFLFALAVLSKESAVALPLAAAGWAVFALHSSSGVAVRRLVPWLVALAFCAALRHLGGGVSPVGGSGRLPKLFVFGTALIALVLLADGRWLQVRERLRNHRGTAALVFGIALTAAAGAAISMGTIGRIAAEKLAVAGFALFHLVSPVVDVSDSPFYLDPSTTWYWAGGVLFLAMTAVVVLALWRRLVDDARMWFLVTLLAATLLPVSALTEGKRYLYLPSAAFSLIAGVLLGELQGSRRRVALGAVGGVLAVSVAEVAAKVDDWRWAGQMTAEGARLVDSTLAPACDAGDVVFLTSPVAIRGVYTHFYYETFELPRGCMPDVFQVLVRVVRQDSTLDVAWETPDRIAITIDPYEGNFVLSTDLRHFDRPLRPGAVATVDTPLGSVRAEPFGREGARLTLTLSEPARRRSPLFFYYSGGRIHPLAAIEHRTRRWRGGTSLHERVSRRRAYSATISSDVRDQRHRRPRLLGPESPPKFRGSHPRKLDLRSWRSAERARRGTAGRSLLPPPTVVETCSFQGWRMSKLYAGRRSIRARGREIGGTESDG